MRILFYCWKAYNQADIISALRRRGHTVDTFELELGNFEVDENFTGRFIDKLFNGEENTACSNVPEAKEHECNERGTAEKLSSVYDAVFSVNYFPIISDICEQFSETGIKYICWTCDSPLSTMYHQSIYNKSNYILIFEKFCYMEFKERGANVFYLPLAAAVERADEALGHQYDIINNSIYYGVVDRECKEQREQRENREQRERGGQGERGEQRERGGQKAYRESDRSFCSDQNKGNEINPGHCYSDETSSDYLYDVSFIGSMYRKNSYDEIKDMLPDYVRGYFDALMKMQMEIYGENYIDGMLTAEIIDELSRHFRIEKSERSFSDISLIFSTTVLGFKIAQLERYKLLEALSKRYDVRVFTDDENANFVLAHNMGPVRYWDESPVVFYNSRINLNFTIRNIRSGIPLRVWDILAAGGFCITNFQPELVMYFKNGEDIVWFEDEADLVKKVGYYLSHEDERKRIALNGQKKVRELHNYDVRLRAIEEAITT